MEHHYKRLGMGVVIAIVGNKKYRSGIGKSWTALRIAELIDPDFREGTTGMNKVVFTPEDFEKAMQYIEEKGKHGQVLVIDESGILINSRQWFTMINKAVSDVIMTWRTLKCIAIFVMPALPVIDKNIRMFVNFMGKIEKVLEGGRVKVKMKFYQMSWDDDDLSKYYLNKVVMYDREKKKVVYLKGFVVEKPKNQALIDAYEEKSKEFKKSIRKGISTLSGSQTDTDSIIEKALKNTDIIAVNSRGRKKISSEDIEFIYDVEPKIARMVARECNRRLLKNA